MADRIVWKDKNTKEIMESVQAYFQQSIENACPVNRLNVFSTELMKNSCGECVICREGTYQIMVQTADMILGKGTEEDLHIVNEIIEDMILGSSCDYGREAGKLCHELFSENQEVFSRHIKRKRCDAGVCEKLSSTLVVEKKEGGLMGGTRRRRRSS